MSKAVVPLTQSLTDTHIWYKIEDYGIVLVPAGECGMRNAIITLILQRQPSGEVIMKISLLIEKTDCVVKAAAKTKISAALFMTRDRSIPETSLSVSSGRRATGTDT